MGPAIGRAARPGGGRILPAVSRPVEAARGETMRRVRTVMAAGREAPPAAFRNPFGGAMAAGHMIDRRRIGAAGKAA